MNLTSYSVLSISYNFNSLLHPGYITCNRHEEQQNHQNNGFMVMHLTNQGLSTDGFRTQLTEQLSTINDMLNASNGENAVSGGSFSSNDHQLWTCPYRH